MKKGSLDITIKTPRKSIKITDFSKTGSSIAELQKQLELTEGREIVSSLANASRTVWNKNMYILATFFQRLCARTPLDEHYMYKIKKKDGTEVEKWHTPDTQQVRMNWYITNGTSILTAHEMVSKLGPELFDTFNNPKSIKLIRQLLGKTFRMSSNGSFSLTIGNDTPYFKTLEYGGYKPESSEIKKWGSNLYEHGIVNHRSVQAPVGMLRITQMEFESMKKEAVSNDVDFEYIFRNMNTEKNLSDARIKQLLSKIKAHRGLSLKDIKEFVE